MLQKEGYLEEDIQDVSDNDCVLISNHGGAYYYEYHSINDKDDSGNLICDYYSTFKKITFNASYNGGTLVGTSPVYIPAGSSLVLPSAEKSGYNFIGWNTDKDIRGSDADNNSLKGGSTFTVTNNIDFYAIYKKPAKKYWITTNANGGTGTAYSSSCTIPAVYNNATQKTSCTAVLPENGFTRSGYLFNGWSTSSSATSGSMPGTTVSLSSNKTYYAAWSSNTKSYTLTYRPNGASGSYYYDTCTTTSGSSTCRIKLRNNPYSRSGYSFGGWGTTSSGGTIYDEGDYITMSSSRSVYAKWTKTSSSKTYTATFLSNGRSYSTKSCTTTGSSCTITTPSAPTSSTYKPDNATSFKWWGTSSTATSGTGANRSLTLTGSRTYYAVWQTSSSSGGSKPSCALTLSGKKGNNNWYTGNVTVNMSTSGTVTSKGLATSSNSTNGKTSVTHTSDTKSVTYYGYVKNSAGSSSCSITFKKDSTRPTLTYTLRRIYYGQDVGQAYSNQYTNNEIKRTLNGSDATSGIYQYQYSYNQSTWYQETNYSYYLMGEGVDDTYYRVVDNAGNTSTVQHIIMKVDWTPPAFRCSFNANKSDCQPNSHVGGACNYTDDYPGSGISYINRSGTYTYNYSGAGCGNSGTYRTEVKSNWDTGFDFCFWCGSSSQVNWTCDGACDNAGNCTGTGYCGNYSW